MNDRLNVLLVEDNPGDAALIREYLREPGNGLDVEIEQVTRLGDALAHLGNPYNHVDVALLDLGLPDSQGIGAVTRLSQAFPSLAIVVLTGLSDDRVGVDSVLHGAQDFLVKDKVDGPLIARTLRYAMVRRRLEQTVRESEAEHRLLFDLSPIPIWVYELETLKFLAVNEAAIRAYGWSRDEFLQMRITDIRPGSENKRLAELVTRPLPASHSAGVWQHVTKDGRGLDVEVTTNAFEFRGRAARLVLARDITEAQRAREALQVSEKRYRDLVEMSKGLVCVHDLNGQLITVNPAAAELLGYAPPEMLGHFLQEYVPTEARPQFQEYLREISKHGEHQGTLVLVAKNGEHRYMQYHNRIYEEPGRPPYVIGHAQDVTERRRYEQRLREISMTDPLTGLHNRRFIAHREEHARPETRWGAVVVDLDHFKEINDTFGHQRGDEVLIGMGAFLKSQSRLGDAVVRMGGDEFLVLLRDTDEQAALALAERIKRSAKDAPCSFSLGVAVREGGEPLEKTIDRADQNLYSVRLTVRGYERRKRAS